MYYRWFAVYGSLFRAVISEHTLNKNSPRSEAEIEKKTGFKTLMSSHRFIIQ